MRFFTWLAVLVALCSWTSVMSGSALAHGGTDLAVLECDGEHGDDSGRTFECDGDGHGEEE